MNKWIYYQSNTYLGDLWLGDNTWISDSRYVPSSIITWKNTILLGFHYLEFCPLCYFLCFQGTLLHTFLFSYECFLLYRGEFLVSCITHVHSLIVIWKNSKFKLSQQNLHTLTTNKNYLSTFARFGNNIWILCCYRIKETTCHRDTKNMMDFVTLNFLQSDLSCSYWYWWSIHAPLIDYPRSCI
jgi:hypothetical protein